MARLRDRAIKALQSIFGREREERQAAESPSAEVANQKPANTLGRGNHSEDVQGLLTISNNLMDRYADYECLTGDTPVITLSGAVPIAKLAELCKKEKNLKIPVFTWDGVRVTVGMAENARMTKIDKVYRILLDNGFSIKATANHPFMMRDGSYTQVRDLNIGDSLMPLYLKFDYHGYWMYRDNGDHHFGALSITDRRRIRSVARMVAEWKLGRRLDSGITVKLLGERHDCHPDRIKIEEKREYKPRKIYTPLGGAYAEAKSLIEQNQQLCFDPDADYHNHKIIGIEELGEEEVYDLSVPGTNNFAVGTQDGGGVFVHNSMEEYPDVRCFAEGTIVFTVEGARVTPTEIEKLVVSPIGTRVLAYNIKKQKIEVVDAISPRLSGNNAKIIAVELDNGKTLRVTPDHKVLLAGGDGKPLDYVNAEKVRKGDKLIGLGPAFIIDTPSIQTNYRWTTIEVTKDPVDAGYSRVFDITTPTHNFVAEGVVCHNSAYKYFASDATQPNLDNGRTIWVESSDDGLKSMADTLIKKQLRLEEDIYSIAYTLVKYGNNFEEVLATENGVVGLKHLPPPTMRRIEDEYGLVGYAQDVTGQFATNMNDLAAMFASESAISDQIAVFEDWQALHFRLRETKRRSAYGYSVADGARWIWKRLIMLEDAVLIYKLSRAPSRFAFYIDVTDVPSNQVEQFLRKAKRDLKKKPIVNPLTGRLEMRYNPLANDEDFFIGVRDGRELSRVEILSGPDYQSLDDVEYFKRMLHGVLQVPREYLGQESAIPARTILSYEDARAARVTLGVQRELRNQIETLIKIDMAARGFTREEVMGADFEVAMTMPSGIYALAAMEVKNAQADFAARVRDFVSLNWIRKNVFKMSDAEIEEIESQARKEQEAAAGGGGGFYADINMPLDSRTQRIIDEQRRREDARDRECDRRHDEILEAVQIAIRENAAFAKRYSSRVAFAEALKGSAFVNKNGRTKALPSAQRSEIKLFDS